MTGERHAPKTVRSPSLMRRGLGAGALIAVLAALVWAFSQSDSAMQLRGAHLSLEKLRSRAQTHPNRFSHQLALAERLLAENEPEEALAALDRAGRLRPGDATTLARVGDAQATLGRTEPAVLSYEAALRAESDSIAALRGLVELHRRSGQAPLMEAHLSRLLSIEPAAEIGPRRLFGWRLLGDSASYTGRVSVTIAAYARWVDLRPNEPAARHSLALALSRDRQWREARVHSDVALRLGGDQPEVLVHVGLALAGSPEPDDRRVAIQSLNQALGMRPDDPRLWAALGVAHRRNLAWEQARRALERLVALAPHRRAERVQLAEVYARLGRRSEAEAQHAAVRRLEGLQTRRLELTEEIRERPRDLALRLENARLLSALGEFGGAATEYRNVLKLDSQASAAERELAILPSPRNDRPDSLREPPSSER